MRIAQIVPNWTEFIADNAYGIKGVAKDLTLGLLKHGHNVTFIAPLNSSFPGVDIQFGGMSLNAQGLKLADPQATAIHLRYAENLLPLLKIFDIVHSHLEHIMLPFIEKVASSVISTIHGANFSAEAQAIFEKYPNNTFVAISRRAVQVLSYIHFSDVIYNGIDLSTIHMVQTPQQPNYIAWLGRFAPEKGALDAISAAKQTGETITLAGFIESGKESYFKQIKDLEDGAKVRLIDKKIGHLKYVLLGNAKTLLFPIHWEEPFGLVMIEAMACGTPVIAYNRGSVPEIVRDGVTGFIIDPDGEDRPGKGSWVIKKQGIEGLVEAVKRIGEIDRAACRKHVEENFSVEKMVEGYEKVYQKIVNERLASKAY